MSDTICGLDRRALASALKYAATEGATSAMIAQLAVAANEPVRSCFAVIDVPAKLAEMLASEKVRLRVKASIFEANGAVVADCEDGPLYKLTPPQARSLLAAWLALPDGDRDGAENALRSVT